MEKESNTNCMEETATMPSYFPCIKSSESHPLADWLYFKSVITSSPELRMMTETYRKRLAISKLFADQYKPEMPAITVSALMDGYGRQLVNFLKPTYMLQLDFDHVKKEDMELLIQLVRGDSHTMVEYITVSGRGFRVFCAYRPVDDDDISVWNSLMPCCRRRWLTTPSSWVWLPTSSVLTSPDAPVLPTIRMPISVGMPSLLPWDRRT